jgi:MFS family permease
MRLAGGLGTLEERQFRLLWTGQAVSAFGDGLYPVALAFAVVRLSGSAGDLGLVFTAVLIPRVVLVLGGGVFADRFPRQRVMLGADVLRSAMQSLTAAFLLSGGDALWVLIVLSVLYGAGDAFFQPAITGLVPQTVRAERIQQANALLALTRSSFWLVGPVAAGALVTTAGPGWAFAGDAATFAVSAALLARIRVSRVPGEGMSFVAELRSGWREVAGRTWVWTGIAYFSISNLAFAPLFVLGPFVAQRSLGGASSWGAIVTCAGVGSLVGAGAAR